jgi:chromosome segregation ATPase
MQSPYRKESNMGLSSLYSNLNYYRGQRNYWQGSADEYARRITKYSDLVSDREEQLRIARDAEPKVRTLSKANSTVKSELTAVGIALDDCAGADDASSAMSSIADPNEEYINEAESALGQLIERLESELSGFQNNLSTAKEGKSYSDSRVRYFNGQISSMQSAINNYREDS